MSAFLATITHSGSPFHSSWSYLASLSRLSTLALSVAVSFFCGTCLRSFPVLHRLPTADSPHQDIWSDMTLLLRRMLRISHPLTLGFEAIHLRHTGLTMLSNRGLPLSMQMPRDGHVAQLPALISRVLPIGSVQLTLSILLLERCPPQFLA